MCDRAREARVFNWLSLGQAQVLREAISEYEEDLGLERSRGASLQAKLAEARSIKDDLAKGGLDRQAHVASLVAQELQHRIETTDEHLAQMEELLTHFRGELARLEGSEVIRGYPRTDLRRMT
jgi:hypothetical protein